MLSTPSSCFYHYVRNDSPLFLFFLHCSHLSLFFVCLSLISRGLLQCLSSLYFDHLELRFSYFTPHRSSQPTQCYDKIYEDHPRTLKQTHEYFRNLTKCIVLCILIHFPMAYHTCASEAPFWLFSQPLCLSLRNFASLSLPAETSCFTVSICDNFLHNLLPVPYI